MASRKPPDVDEEPSPDQNAEISQTLQGGIDMRKRLLIVIPVWLLLGVSGALAQSVIVNWEERAPFSDYHTYAWRAGREEGAHFFHQWVVRDVDAELAQKGFRRVRVDENPDLYLYYHIAAMEVMDSTTTVDGVGWGPGPWRFWGGWGGFGPGIAQTTVQPRTMGILTIDMVDAKMRRLVWRGQATVDNISNSQKGDEKLVKKSIQKMFKQFPPPKTS
jgi:hypothetical protein